MPIVKVSIPMNTNIMPLTSLAVGLIMVLSGCVAKKAQVGETRQPQNEQPAVRSRMVPERPGNSYYYYTEAQLEMKKGRYERALVLLDRAIELDPDSNLLHRTAASLHIVAKDTETAASILEGVLARDPEDVEALIILGKLQQDRRETDQAKATYAKVIQLDPTKREIYLMLGALYLEDEQLEEGLATFQALVERHPDAYAGFFFIGQIQARKGNTALAEKAFLRTLELAPDLQEPRFELLHLYERQEQANEKIVAMYQEILAGEPGNVRAGLGLGLHYHEQGNHAQAEEIFRDLGQRSRFDPEINRKIVQRYLDTQKYEQATVILKGMLVGAPESSDIQYLMGVAYSGQDQADEAIHHFDKVKPDSRFHENAAVHTALLYQEQGKLHEGIRHLEAVIQKVPDNPEYLLYLGSFYEELEQYQKAAETIKRGLALDQNNPRLHFRLGVIYDKWGKKEASIKAMKTVIEIEPQNANALNYLGYTYADMGQNLDEAEQLVKRALLYKPEDGYITDSLGWVYYQMGRYEKALEVLKQAAELVPDDPIILEHLGDAYLKTGDRDNALKYYKKSSQLQKKDPSAILKKIAELQEAP